MRKGGKMKILLVKNQSDSALFSAENLTIFEPLSLEYIGAGVRKHHDVKLLDLRVETGYRETLESFCPDIIGLGGCTVDVKSIKRLVSEAKEVSPNVLTVVGGCHATVAPADFFEDYIDVVIKGEGVNSFKKLCECHEEKRNFESIENIYFRTNGKMQFSFEREFPSLDTFPLPDRTLTSTYRDNYYYPIPAINTFASIRGSAGCYFRCKFCSVSHTLKRKLYTRQIDSIIEELNTIKEPMLFWVDDEFFLDSEHATQLAREIEKAGIKKYHHIMCRSDTIIKHPECIEEWAKINLSSVMVGLESHQDEGLKKLRKDSRREKNEEAINILKKNNVLVRGNFIVNQDFEEEDFKKLLEYVKGLDLSLIGFTVLTPFLGTELYEECKDQLITDDFDLFDLYHTVLPTKLPLKQFYKEYCYLFSHSVPLKKRLKFFKQFDFKDKWKLLSTGAKMIRGLKKSYQLYNN
jgi:hopanoid C-3 methylase